MSNINKSIYYYGQLFTSETIDTDVLPITTDKEIIGFVIYEDRLVAITSTGNLFYSPVGWNKISGWLSDPTNLGGCIRLFLNDIKPKYINVCQAGIVIVAYDLDQKEHIFTINTFNPEECKVTHG